VTERDAVTEAWLRQLARALAAAVVAIPPEVRAKREAEGWPVGLSRPGEGRPRSGR
jgi:hypothetical protein